MRKSNLYWSIKVILTESKRKNKGRVWVRQTISRKNSKNEVFYTLPVTKWATPFFHNIKKKGFYETED